MQEKNNYYVYVFKRKDNDVVFYVGSGRLNRVNQKQSRNKDCSHIMNTIGYYSELIHEGLSKREAREIEEGYIKNPLNGWELTNKRLPTKTNELDAKVLAEFFYYDPTSPSGLRYARNTYKNRGALAKSKDEVAGRVYKGSNGEVLFWRVSVTIAGTDYTFKAHRVVWCLVHGSIDANLVIDHVDNNPANNEISNLRLVTFLSNGRNKKQVKCLSSTGIAGLSLSKGKCYKAEITDKNGKRVGKSFSINKYGEKMALYLAAKARYEYLDNLPENKRYSDNHTNLEELIKIITNFESENINGTKSLGA